MLEEHPITLSSPLDKSADEFLQGLVFHSMFAHEELGRPFEYTLQVLSHDRDLKTEDLLFKAITVGLEIGMAEQRFFNGVVVDFGLIGSVGEFALYEAAVVPFLWFLGKAKNCRIFQTMTVPDIVREVCRKYGFTDIDSNGLSGIYLERDFVVQYNETDLNFVSRLLEQEGIYYWFRHEETKHTLVLADSVVAHQPAHGTESLPFRPPDPNRVVTGDCVDSWKFGRRVNADAFAVKDYDFERPTAPLLSPMTEPDDQTLEVFEFGGAYPYTMAQDEEILQRHNEDPRDAYVRVRLEELQTRSEKAVGRTNARGLLVGSTFKLTEFPRRDQNRKYLITSTKYTLHGQSLRSAGGSGEQTYQCVFHAHDAERPFRPTRRAKKTRIVGPQYATVVGKDGEEIWTDEYGRVKLLFPWDRYGSGVEDSSCWIRVSQLWAGAKWGGIHIPRIGQEVIVEFVDGDPDRPIITGRVYNADNMPPYDLPANQTQSGIKSHSTKGGQAANFNEIRFEDKKGQEELHVQAEKNYTELVKNDKSVSVKANRSASVGGNDSVSVTGDRSVSVQGNLSVTVQGKGKSPVHSTQSVTGKHSLDASDTIEVTAPTHIKFTVGGTSILIEPGKITLHAEGGGEIVIDADILAKSNAGSQIKLDPNAFMTGSGGGNVLLDANVLAQSKAGHAALLDAGKAQITAGGSGVELTPSAITINSSTVTASGGGGSVELGAAGATMSGSKATVSGGQTEITGSIVKIN